jgi:hypothetical protein
MQNGLNVFITFVICFFIVVDASANESGFKLSASLVGMSMDYREYDDNNAILDSETSKFTEMAGPELRLEYTHVHHNTNYSSIGVNMAYLSGTTEYKGAMLDPVTLTYGAYGSYVGTTKNIIFDTSVDYKFTHSYKYGLEFGYGVGVGYRSWRRELSPSQVEVYAWPSIRPNIAIRYRKKWFKIGTTLEYQYGINPEMTVLKDSENPDTTLHLGSANILQISIPIEFVLTDYLTLFVENSYQYQVIEKSDSAAYVYNSTAVSISEPKSTANNLYTKFGMAFKF